MMTSSWWCFLLLCLSRAALIETSLLVRSSTKDSFALMAVDIAQDLQRRLVRSPGELIKARFELLLAPPFALELPCIKDYTITVLEANIDQVNTSLWIHILSLEI